ncbi:MAG: LysM peptidoglycan-binding domain-containing protein [Eubacteriales bacterium]|nr:LysM peptidoglycan-binding domain-containing protein [Eubacteriales bacterium]
MQTDRIRENETPEQLAVRLGVPLCMLLRANRLACACWLLPEREIAVPQGAFCEKDAFPCPARLLDTPARQRQTEVCIAGAGDDIPSLARALGTSERLLLRARGRSGPLREGERILIEAEKCKKRIGSVLPGETLKAFCARQNGADPGETARLNELRGGQVWPGMRLVLPGRV